MGKKVKVREVEPKFRIVCEAKDEEIKEVTEGEPRIHEDSVVMNFRGSGVKVSPVLKSEDVVRDVEVFRPIRREREMSGVQLYAVGRGMGNEAQGERANYRQARQTENAVQMIRDSGGGIPVQQRGLVPQGSGVQERNVLQNESAVPKRDYSEGTKKHKPVGPWN